MATILVPKILNVFTDGITTFETSKPTIETAIVDLLACYPLLRIQIFDENMMVRQYIKIYLDKNDIQLPKDKNLPLSKRSKLRILQSVAGG